MVTKRKGTSQTEETKRKVKVGKLNLKKETVKDLAAAETRKVKGGGRPREPDDMEASQICTLILIP